MEALMLANDAEYGEWFRCELRDGRVVYIGGCGECGTPWLETEEPELSSEWVAIEPVAA